MASRLGNLHANNVSNGGSYFVFDSFGFEPVAVQIALCMLVLIYLASTVICFRITPKNLVSRCKLILQVFAFALVFTSIWFSVFENRHQWVGIELYHVPSNSMSPTLSRGDFIVGDLWLYATSNPQNGEIIIFHHNENLYIKRVFASEGEAVFLKGANISKIYSLSSTRLSIKQNEIFVVGDNPSKSRDSRHYGPVTTDAVEARARLKMFSIKDNSIEFSAFGKQI